MHMKCVAMCVAGVNISTYIDINMCEYMLVSFSNSRKSSNVKHVPAAPSCTSSAEHSLKQSKVDLSLVAKLKQMYPNGMQYVIHSHVSEP